MINLPDHVRHAPPKWSFTIEFGCATFYRSDSNRLWCRTACSGADYTEADARSLVDYLNSRGASDGSHGAR